MRRRFGLVLLVWSLLWQSAVLAGSQWLPDHQAQDLVHTVLHWQDEAHHHHADGSYHLDDSYESTAHVQFDGAVHLSALLASPVLHTAAIQGVAPPTACQLVFPTPPPECRRRPPRSGT